MLRPEFEGGLPRTTLENGDLIEVLQTRYGNFAIAVLLEVMEIDAEAPRDILTFGENWYQLTETRESPRAGLESVLQQQGARIFGDMWPIRPRDSSYNDIYQLMEAIKQGVEADTLDRRILDKLAVLDLSSDNPALREDDLLERVDTPWGTNGILQGTRTLIYHITSGFARQRIEDAYGSPGDDFSMAIFHRGGKKWL